MRPAAITHVTDLDHERVIELTTSLVVQLLELLLHFLDGLVRASGSRRILLLAVLIDVDVDIINFLALRKQRIHVVLLRVTSLLAQAALALVLSSFLLLLLSLQLLSEVLLLLCVETLKQLLVIDFVASAGTFAFAVDLRDLRLVRASAQILIVALAANKITSLHVDLLAEVVSTSAGHLHVHLLDVIILTHFGRRQLTRLRDLADLLVSQADVHVLRLEVSMNNLAHAMHVVETNQALLRQLSHQRQRDTLVLVSLDDLKEVDTENFENHDEMLAIRSVMNKRVQQLRAMRRLRDNAELVETRKQVSISFVVLADRNLPFFRFPVLGHLIEDVDFIVSSLNVMLRTLLHLEGDVRVVLEILRQPHGGEVTPTELLNDDISIN